MDEQVQGSAADPGFEVPPAFGDADERRMHARAYNHWSALLNGRAFPSVADLHPASLDDFGPHSILLDFSASPEAPRLRFIGKQLREECGLDGFDLLVDEVPARSLVSRLTDHFHEILANRAPVGFEADFVSKRGAQTLYRGILMPLSSNGCSIDYIYGVINWKEIAGVDLTAAIERELAAVEMPSVGETNIARRLAMARSAASLFDQTAGRSRAALYRALASAYEVYLASVVDVGGFAWLVAEARLKVQARAPMTPVVKLVFGARLDKARITEFAAALAVGARAGVPSGRFEAFIEAAGGLKILVAAERLARRTRIGRTVADRTVAVRARLRMASAVAHIAIPSDGGEFVLLIARRAPNGTLFVLESVPDATKLVDIALRKLGSASCRELSQAA